MKKLAAERGEYGGKAIRSRMRLRFRTVQEALKDEPKSR
jgi:hypothetical protein